MHASLHCINRGSSHRFNQCLEKIVAKYELTLVAGNFYRAEYQPCVDVVLNALDDPQYVEKAVLRAKRTETKLRDVPISEETVRKYLESEDADEAREKANVGGSPSNLKLRR